MKYLTMGGIDWEEEGYTASPLVRQLLTAKDLSPFEMVWLLARLLNEKFFFPLIPGGQTASFENERLKEIEKPCSPSSQPCTLFRFVPFVSFACMTEVRHAHLYFYQHSMDYIRAPGLDRNRNLFSSRTPTVARSTGA